MRVMSLALAAVLVFVLASCGDDGATPSLETSDAASGVAESALAEPRDTGGRLQGAAPSLAPQAAPPAPSEGATSPDGTGSGSVDLQLAGRQVIRTASLTVRVSLDAEVARTAQRAALIAESHGGFVERMSISTGDEHQRASMVLRVPQSAFRDVVSELAALGEVLDQSLGSQDVSGEVIDLEARVRALRTQEARLLELLGRAEDLQQVLTLERELTRTRSQIEQIEGQLRFIERRVELATVTLELLGPAVSTTAPPSASLTLEAARVEEVARRVQEIARQVDGVVDEVVIDVADGKTSALVRVRVPRDRFQGFLSDVERLGTVEAKALRDPQATESADGEPDARVSVQLEQAEDGPRGLLIGLAAVLVLTSAAGAIGLVVRYRARRRRATGADGE